jgi:hypothetical protein
MSKKLKTDISETVTICEKCDKSIFCRNLRPCNAYVPALNTNFWIDVEIPTNTFNKAGTNAYANILICYSYTT